MRAVLCKNVPAVRDFRDVICRAAWKYSGSVCGHVAPFPVFPEIFSDFLPFGGGILAGISQPGEEKWSPGSFFRLPAVIKLAVLGKFLSSCWQKMTVPGKFCPSDDIKLAVSGNKPEKSGIFSGGRNGFFQAFLSVP